MDQATVLEQMKAFFREDDRPPEVLESLAETKATDVLHESIESLEFLMYLEGKLGTSINVNQVGPALANMTFGELAAEICRQLDE